MLVQSGQTWTRNKKSHTMKWQHKIKLAMINSLLNSLKLQIVSHRLLVNEGPENSQNPMNILTNSKANLILKTMI